MPPPQHDPSELELLSQQYRDFARFEHGSHGSPIYSAIWQGLADDPDIGALALLAQPGFRTPTILPAAVHHLLLGGLPHRLGAYYPSVSGSAARRVDGNLYPAFADLVAANRQQVVELVRSRTTQTNEAGRAVLLMPPLAMVAAAERRPAALLEVGPSAGLNLLLDRYAYRIGEREGGDPGSAVRLECTLEGNLLPPLPAEPLRIAWRIGLDLNPLDVRRAATADWLRALVWPEHTDRMAILDAALAIAREDPPRLVRGDLVDDLREVAATAPPEASLVVTHTWVLAYVTPERRRAFIRSVRQLAASRGQPVWLVSCEAQSVLASLEVGVGQAPEGGNIGASALALHRFEPDGSSWHRLLADCHAHGRWIRWLDPAAAAGRA